MSFYLVVSHFVSYICVTLLKQSTKNMTETISNAKKDKRTEKLTDEEIQLLKEKAAEAKSFSSFSVGLKVERTALINTLARGSASPATVRKIRRFIEKQTA